MKNKFIIATLFSAFLLISPNVKAANYTDNQTVDANKTWTIRFTGDVGFDDLTKQGITVIDSKGNNINVGLQLGQDKKTVTVTAPQGGYAAGESYTLNVGNKAHSKKGKALKNEYKLYFNIKSNNEIVTFKDKNLEKAVRDAINKSTGDIYKSDVEKITTLDVKGKGITDISGIEKLTNLKILDLSYNHITDISALEELTNLQNIDLQAIQINDISALKGLTNLENLSIIINNIKDVSALKGLTNLQYLWLDIWKISKDDLNLLKNALPNCQISNG